jgi:uncharacterized membrane protein YkoI
MRPPRRLAMIIALALAITAIGAATGWLVLRRDPSVQVGSVPISGISVRAAPTTSATRSQQVEALDRLEGTFHADDDPGQFTLGSVDLDFGPEAWVLTAGPLQDYDQDQRTEALLDELAGLTGQQVTTLVRPGDSGDEADVYVLNDLPYRDPAGPPPWTTAAPTSSATASEDQLRTAAAAAVGESARVVELEREPAGQVAWEASLIAADGTEYTVLLSAAGDVLDVRQS